jgi:HNH endonuclease
MADDVKIVGDNAGVMERPVPGFPGYTVDTEGVVRSYWKYYDKGARLTDVPQRVLVARRNRYGYPRVTPCRDGRHYTRAVHRLVLEAHVGPCPPSHEGAHLNGVRSDNRLANLAWKTKSENAADQQRHGTQVRGERQGRSKLTAVGVTRIKAYLAEGVSRRVLARNFHVSRSTIDHIATGRKWSHIKLVATAAA